MMMIHNTSYNTKYSTVRWFKATKEGTEKKASCLCVFKIGINSSLSVDSQNDG